MKTAHALRSVPLPIPRTPVPNAQRIDTLITDVRQWTKDAREAVLGYSLRIGRALISLRDLMAAEGRPFYSLFPKKDAGFQDAHKLPFALSTATKLITIAENQALIDFSHEKKELPRDWNTLYDLARIPAPRLQQLIKDGTVHAAIKRTDAERLQKGEAKGSKAKPRKKATPKGALKDATIDERRLDQRYTAFVACLRTLPRVELVREFRNLAQDFGIADELLKQERQS